MYTAKTTSRLGVIGGAIAAVSLILGILGTALIGQAQVQTYQTIGSRLGPGSRGSEVARLQTFLASNHLIYPEGLVTGYYGPLTETAVTQFQIGYDIPPVGKVGQITLARLNGLIATNHPIDVSAPKITGLGVTTSTASAIVSVQTDKPSTVKVFYAITPIISLETSRAKTEPTISGAVSADRMLNTTHQISITNLSSNTLYYYVVETADDSGNVSMTLQNTFVTP